MHCSAEMCLCKHTHQTHTKHTIQLFAKERLKNHLCVLMDGAQHRLERSDLPTTSILLLPENTSRQLK